MTGVVLYKAVEYDIIIPVIPSVFLRGYKYHPNP